MSSTTLLTVKNKGRIISSQCRWARSGLSRMVGLLSYEKLDPHESLLIEPCKQVHTWFMRFPIDVVFLDKDNRILSMRSMKPWKLSPLLFKARKVLELTEGTCEKEKLEIGNILIFETEPSYA